MMRFLAAHVEMPFIASLPAPDMAPQRLETYKALGLWRSQPPPGHKRDTRAASFSQHAETEQLFALSQLCAQAVSRRGSGDERSHRRTRPDVLRPHAGGVA